MKSYAKHILLIQTAVSLLFFWGGAAFSQTAENSPVDSDKELQVMGRYNLQKLQWVNQVAAAEKKLQGEKEGSAAWLAEYGTLIASGEKSISLCQEYAGCRDNQDEVLALRSILAGLYAERAYQHIFGGGNRQTGIDDVNRMMALDNNFTHMPRIIFWRGFMYISSGYFDYAQQELDLLSHQYGADFYLTRHLALILTENKK